jgi:ATP-dependent DNA helicase Rep
VLDALLHAEPGLADEVDNLEDLSAATLPGGALAAFTVEIFGNQGGVRTRSTS